MRNLIVRLTIASSLALLLPAPPALAASKEIIELQTQVQQLQDMLQHLQTTNDERMGLLVHLVQQNTDSVNKLSADMSTLQTSLKTQSDAAGATNTQLSGQLQALNDSIDEMKTRLNALNSQVQAIQGQMQNVNSAAPAGGQSAPQGGYPGQGGQAPQGGSGPQASNTPTAPPVDQLYQSALRDYNSARYPLAASEFGDVIHYYPQDQLAGNASFYLGEIDYRQGKYADAVKSYDTVLEQFSGNPKAPASELRKGESLINLGQKDAGVRELRALVQRYPQTPEAQEGRTRLRALGVATTASKPSAYRE